jgi:glycosyltransferase involved in cell wall biosynthesis
MTTYSTAFLVSGGGESELVQIAELLNNSGVQTDIYGINSRPLNFYQYVMHFSTHADGEDILREAIRRGKNVLLWPNVWWTSTPSEPEIKRITEISDRVNRLFFKSQTELNNFVTYIPVDHKKCIVVPIGVSDRFLLPVDMDLLPTVCDISNYVVCLGLIEPIKNQLALIRALNALSLNGLMIGGFRDEEYYQRCVKEAHSGIRFLPFIQPCSALLRSALANATLVAEPSFDPPGRSSLESAFLRKPLVLVDGPWQREHFGNGLSYASSGSAISIASAIEMTLADPEKDAKVASIYDLVHIKHSSEVVSQILINILVNLDANNE